MPTGYKRIKVLIYLRSFFRKAKTKYALFFNLTFTWNIYLQYRCIETIFAKWIPTFDDTPNAPLYGRYHYWKSHYFLIFLIPIYLVDEMWCYYLYHYYYYFFLLFSFNNEYIILLIMTTQCKCDTFNMMHNRTVVS